MPSDSQVKHEMLNLAQRIQPVMSEHFDAYFLIGCRAGSRHCPTLTVMGEDTKFEERLENEILILAATIARRRNGKT